MNNIFISHGRSYATAYYTVEKWLNEEMNNSVEFSWVNCSSPNDSNENSSGDSTEKMFMDKIKNEIQCSSIFIVISDMYKENKKLIDFEIATAKQSGKYIIALKRWRNLKPVPKMILKNADETINLCSSELINAIQKHIKTANLV
ncbi:MAG: TIR domain-containing protein [Eubacteriales bacterium]